MTILLRAFEYSSFLHHPDSIRTYEFASSNAYLNVVERASRILRFHRKKRHFYTKIQPKCPPFLKRLLSLLLFSLSRRTKNNSDLLLSDKEDNALFQHPRVLAKVRLFLRFLLSRD